VEKKVEGLLARLSEVETELGDPKIFGDQKRYRALAQEHARLKTIREIWEEFISAKKQLTDNEALLQEGQEADFAQMLEEDNQQLVPKVEKLELKMRDLLIPPNPLDHKNTILELRAGTGGDEAALFVGDCIRMYQLFADHKGWSYERLGATPSERGGFKEYIMVVSGENVHRLLQYEGGTHRVQRVPETEAQGRIHTSAITVAILLEPDEEISIEIDEKDLRIETFRASGAGGQHINVTDSAVRIVHEPTGVVVSCQEERSQHKNRDKAMRHLKAKLLEAQIQKQAKERAEERASQVGTGDRSERIRTYNFPQNRVTDHRINLTLYHLDRVMNGDLDEIIGPLVLHYYEDALRST